MRKIFILSISIVALTFAFIYKNYKSSKKIQTQDIVIAQNRKIDISKTISPVFSDSGIDHIALVTMVKDEEDIIYENLVWHYAVGFRKFFIVDNKSNDETMKKIEKFANLTKDKAKVFILSDPIFEHIQSRIITGAYNYIGEIWPEVTWIFPVDADEFWTPVKNFEQILRNIPAKYDAIMTLRVIFDATKDYFSNNKDKLFYESINYRVNKFDGYDCQNETTFASAHKVAVRSNNKEISIAQGNHNIYYNLKAKTIANYIQKPKTLEYASGNTIGLHMFEYPMRSPNQVHSKLYNGMKANMAAKRKGMLPEDMGMHWDEYEYELNKDRNNAALKRFERTFIEEDDGIYDPLPINKALEFFNKDITMDSNLN